MSLKDYYSVYTETESVLETRKGNEMSIEIGKYYRARKDPQIGVYTVGYLPDGRVSCVLAFYKKPTPTVANVDAKHPVLVDTKTFFEDYTAY